ncbi:transglycosylase domain-containing protein [Streptomyces sp. NPDC058045]|uniref:transglycosylase domain-containing protein n=1 Tax=Streptomyces sp. NPDC058045 TaxID=3346311 RepID=UPI0036EDF3AB
MSEHRRKPPQPPGGGRAAARRGTPGAPSGHRGAPRDSAGSPSGSYGAPSGSGERPYGGRAEARRAAQRAGRGRRRAPDGAGSGGGRRGGGGGGRGRGGPGGAGGPGRGRGRGPAPKKRFIDYPRAGKHGVARWVPSWRLVTGLFVAFLGSLMAVAGIAYAWVDMPRVAETATAQNNVYYWADGSQMVATGGETNRQIINYEKIPESMRWAVISAENKTFWTDRGVDPMGIGRALVNMAKGGQTQGGSTITQQYVKNARLDDRSQTLSRKFKELFISIKVGARVPKEEIIAGYLNSAYYGRNAYGVQAAARAYFNEDATELQPDQTAVLAAVLKGATYYDPAGNPGIDPSATRQANTERATKRWSWILDQEVKDGHLSQEKRAKYTKLPRLESPRNNAKLGGQTGYLVDLAKTYVIGHTDITADELALGGYEIHTTFQQNKVNSLKRAVAKVQKANIKPKQRPDTDTHVQFGGASVNPKDGSIEAIYGGEDWTRHFTNNADYTGAQVGSTFKPFVLAAALRDGVRDPDGGEVQGEAERTIASPKSLYSGKNDFKIKNYNGDPWTNKEGKEWLQENDGQDNVGSPPEYLVSLREAMRESVNSAYVQLGMDVGLDKVKQAAVDSGVLDDSLANANYPSFSIGTSSPSAIRMAGAYATYAASGKQNDPYSVTEVKHRGTAVYQHKSATKQPFTSQVADNVTDVLKTVVDKGTGSNAKLPDRQVAGKTGTTDGNKSAWFVGYTPQLSTAISMYRMDDNEKTKSRHFLQMFGTGGQKKIHGASFPSEIWHDYMAQALKGKPAVPFPAPEPIGEVVGSTPPPPPPSPTPSVTPSPSASDPTTSPSPSDDPSGSPKPTGSCQPWDWKCGKDTGGTNNGGTDTGGTNTGGATGGTDTGGTGGGTGGTDAGTSTGQNGGTRGNGNGGIFGGPAG